MDITFDVAKIEAGEFGSGKKGVGGHSITPTPNHQVAGVDSVSLAVWLQWKEQDHVSFRAELSECQERARVSNKSEFFEWRGYQVEVSPYGTRDGGGFPYRFTIDGVYFACGNNPDVSKRHNMQVSFMGGAMIRFGWNALDAFRWMESVLLKVGARYIDKHTVSRVDLFADCVGVHVKSFESIARKNGFVSRARQFFRFRGVEEQAIRDAIARASKGGLETLVAEITRLWGQVEHSALADAFVRASTGSFDMIQFGKTTEDLGFQLGKRDAVCRIYNKVLQLEKHHPERKDVMYEAWGVEEGTPVTRVEYQYRGTWLRTWNITTIEDLDAMLPSLAEYSVHKWCVAYSGYDGSHTDRREVARVWKRVQAFFKVGFDGYKIRMQKRQVEPKDNGTQLLRMSLGFATAGIARQCGPCESPADVRQTLIEQLDRAVVFAGGWSEVFAKQVKEAARYTNRLGLSRQHLPSEEARRVMFDELFESGAGIG